MNTKSVMLTELTTLLIVLLAANGRVGRAQEASLAMEPMSPSQVEQPLEMAIFEECQQEVFKCDYCCGMMGYDAFEQTVDNVDLEGGEFKPICECYKLPEQYVPIVDEVREGDHVAIDIIPIDDEYDFNGSL